MGLGQIGEIKDEFFLASGTLCRNYFKAINMVFHAYQVRDNDVRNTLAALAARRCLDGISIVDEFVPNMMAHLSQSQGQVSGKVPPWTETVYATYLLGWLNDFVEMKFNYRRKFKKRAFLS